MNVKERLDDPLAMLSVAQRSAQSKLWTSIPGIIQSFNAAAMTCVVQPAIQSFVTDDNGAMVLTNLPLLTDCPVQFPAGGGCTLTFPVVAGDECLVVFASRCIDSWWQSGGIQAQAELRMHDLSDGFALLGFRSQPRVIGGISLQAVQLRSDDGQAFVEINPTTHAVNATTSGPASVSAQGGITLTAPLVTINGDVKVNGKVDTTGDVKAGTISLQLHKHTGVTPGSGTSGGPTP
ncbi:Gp138 family membrane-puncturing spike protein [Pseudomonas sp. MSSRFD41]|uniref:Gp138 family membrane-puncturing spike protein n=1 Tax=Pseudomonas sp. MSSRFD41 TaxID=1310370 RepID=UPI001C8C4CCD|nr:Gp138 family membrane-puncturing spike protein [Pseudomonas sp. MSSRFD41]